MEDFSLVSQTQDLQFLFQVKACKNLQRFYRGLDKDNVEKSTIFFAVNEKCFFILVNIKSTFWWSKIRGKFGFTASV